MVFDLSFILYTLLLVYALLGVFAAFAAYRILRGVVRGLVLPWGAREADRSLEGSVRKAQMTPLPNRP